MHAYLDEATQHRVIVQARSRGLRALLGLIRRSGFRSRKRHYHCGRSMIVAIEAAACSGRIFTVGGYTLLSRLTGFARDIMLAAILGAGPVADAFFVALRLPNHFRAIFAEGAFNAAFVPAYAACAWREGEAVGAAVCRPHLHAAVRRAGDPAGRGAGVHAAGDRASSRRASRRTPAARRTRDRADADHVSYLLLITLVTLYGGMLNVMHRFAAPRRRRSSSTCR